MTFMQHHVWTPSGMACATPRGQTAMQDRPGSSSARGSASAPAHRAAPRIVACKAADSTALSGSSPSPPGVPPPVPRDVEAVWQARARDGMGTKLAAAPQQDCQQRTQELLLHLKRLSSARAHATAVERSRHHVMTVHAPLPVHATKRAVDDAMIMVRHEFRQRSPRIAAREKAAVAARAQAASAAVAASPPEDAATPTFASPTPPSTPAPAPNVQCPIPQRSVSIAANEEHVRPGGPTKAFRVIADGDASPSVAEISPHAFGSLKKRQSSTTHASGQRTYSSWLSKKSSLRRGLVSALGSDKANSLVLTGSERMEGKVTSLSMISQGLAQQKKLVASLKAERCFRGANSVHLAMISTVARTRYHSRYSVVYREGASAYTFYVLVRGAIKHASSDGTSRIMRASAGDPMLCFGTEGLGAGMARSTTATCLENCEILHFTTFRMRLSEQGAEDYARKAFAVYVENELQKMPLFFGLRSTTLFQVSAMFELRECASAGTVLFRPGAPSDALYILAKGRIMLENPDGSEECKLQAGSVEDGYPFFGERSLLEGGPMTNRAITRTPCKLLVLPKVHFERICKLMPNLKARLQEFYELRAKRVELARLAAADRIQRRKYERRACLRDKGLTGLYSGFGADGDAEDDADALDVKAGAPADEEDIKPADEEEEHAATAVQKVWRGSQARTRGSPKGSRAQSPSRRTPSPSRHSPSPKPS